MSDIDELEKVFEIPARFIDITLQNSQVTSILLKDGVAKDISSGEVSGIGIRILNKVWGFATTNTIENLNDMVERAYKISKQGNEKIEFSPSNGIEDRVKVKSKIDPIKVFMDEKITILHEIEEVIKDYDKVVSHSFSYSDSKVKNYYMNSEGSKIKSEYNRVALFTSVFAKKDGRIQVGLERLGATSGLEALERAGDQAKNAAEKAIRLLDAKEAPRGKFKLVLDPTLAGVFIHEALGHGVEADHVIRGESILAEKLNTKIASDMVTVYDDPALKKSFGFYFYDSEGTKGIKKSVIENGVLKGYLHSRETSSQLGQKNTGNARSQSYSHQPIVRMSNTYFGKGDSGFEEMIEDIKEGVYLKGSRGGEVDTARGVFQFSAEEGFMIKNGEVAEPIKDVAMSGETLKILQDIDAIGKDFSMHIGFCGKEGQFVPVGDGGPHIRTLATVGGTRNV